METFVLIIVICMLTRIRKTMSKNTIDNKREDTWNEIS